VLEEIFVQIQPLAEKLGQFLTMGFKRFIAYVAVMLKDLFPNHASSIAIYVESQKVEGDKAENA
jgi:hypothetical protein